ncbi:MAG: hypothetical protein COA42_22335 [Alteromonadaceae bacterium]|nr:MAG: hypothetical protein COA42_22335 [Alteromonadaceae bacterium]
MITNQENTENIATVTAGFTAIAKANLHDIFMMLGDYGLPERSHTGGSEASQAPSNAPSQHH